MSKDKKLYVVQWEGRGIWDSCQVIRRYVSFNWGQFHQSMPVSYSTAKRYKRLLQETYPNRWVKILPIKAEEKHRYTF